MARRKPKPLPPRAHRSTRAPRIHLDSLPAPNHLAPLDWSRQRGRRNFPLLHLQLPEAQGAGTPGLPAFVDRSYGLRSWAERDDRAPPTWMDPELFIRQALRDPDIQEHCRNIIARQDPQGYQQLLPQLDRLLDEYYLVYLYMRFAEVREILARWLVAHVAARATPGSPDSPRKTHATRNRGIHSTE